MCCNGNRRRALGWSIPVTTRKNISSIDRLQQLPAVFRGADLTVRFAWSSKHASQYLYLWKRRGLVAGLGGKSDVFCNLLVCRQPNWEKAMRMAMPTAVITGVEAIRQAGWTTQIPQRATVAVSMMQPVYSVDPYLVTFRPQHWVEATQGALVDSAAELPVLRPAWALADLLKSGAWGTFGLWPDDIDWDEVDPSDEADWELANAYFGLGMGSLHELAQPSR